VFSLVSDFSKFHVETQKLKKTLLKNDYPESIIDCCIKTFLNKIFTISPEVITVSKKELTISLPYLGKLSLNLRTRIKDSLEKQLGFIKIRVIFTSKTRIKDFFSFKDKMPQDLLSNLVYKFTCGSCNATYYGKTFRLGPL